MYMKRKDQAMLAICNAFQLEGAAVSCVPYGSGHINATYLVKTDADHAYILQKINDSIFRDVAGLMENIQSVTAHLSAQDPDPRHSLHLIPTKEGAAYLRGADGGYYRVYDFVTDSLGLDAPETDQDFYESAVAFGHFQQMLADFPAEKPHETIPHFHDTPSRYQAFHKALQADVKGRAKECQTEIAFALAHEQDAAYMMNLLAAGKLPLRVTHNDTKLNNVLLDKATRKALCVIDLDTVMPGLAANDFGDSIRFGANTGTEDEKDLRKTSLSLSRFEAFTKGFLAACGKALTPLEIETLPWGAKLMTLECGVRFLTDYLSGDTYFRIHRPEHNLDRTRTQFALVADMERKWADMAAIVARQ